MRGLTALILSFVLYSISVAQAAPDLSPIGCAWDKLPVAEQTRLRDEFKVDLKDKGFVILFATANAALAAEAAAQCPAPPSAAQVEQLALGLARHAGELKAAKGITDHGENAGSIQIALEKMHEGKREVIGDALACPGPHPMVTEWDESMKGAIRRANLRFENGRAYSFVSLGLYSVMAQEGTMRRMAGKADACS